MYKKCRFFVFFLTANTAIAYEDKNRSPIPARLLCI